VAFRVLSFDGGPHVGCYVRCLAAIERARPGFLDRVDLLIGSSAGACTAVFLGGRLTPGADGAAVAADAVEYADGILRSMAPEDGRAYKRLLKGDAPLIESDNISTFLADNTRDFGDLARRVTVLSCKAHAPYDPVITANFGPGAAAESSVDVIVRSSSLPLWSTPHQGHVDGALFTNNPATTGLLDLLSRTRGGEAPVSLDDVVLLSFGGDDGSSRLSNLRCPGVEDDGPDVLTLLKTIGVPISKKLTRSSQHLAELQQELLERLQDLGLDIDPEQTPSGERWGWRHWLGYPGNLAYAFQVWTSSEGRGAHWQCQQLLGKRAFRVAPVGPLSTNEALLALFLGKPEPVIDVAKLTSGLWEDPVGSAALKFDADLQETLAWVDQHWMPGAPAAQRPRPPEDRPPERDASDPAPPPRRRRRDRLREALRVLLEG
jgi:hypothetical protein